MPGNPNVHTVSVNGRWLNGSRELPICLAQPQFVPPEIIAQDRSRPDSLALAEAIFGTDNGQQRLARWFHNEAGLLLFPEYAFGSGDFASLNQLIQGYPHPLIVIAGFGAAHGSKIASLLQTCNATWPEGIQGIEEQANYNAGWCWINKGPTESTCLIFLKNYFEQHVEITIPNLFAGKYILKIVADDIVLFPLICADLICDTPESPRTRIRQTLPTTSDGISPDLNRKVIVAAVLNTNQPFHGLWRPAINDVVTMHNRGAVLCTVNQPLPDPDPDSSKDHWRCLSGGFIHKSGMSRRPEPPLPSVRYVSTDSASGLIIRQSRIGVTCGAIRWEQGPDLGRNLWVPNVRRVFTSGSLVELGESVEVCELKRFVQRRRSAICNQYHASIANLIATGLDEIINETDTALITPRLWTRLLSGIESGSLRAIDVDEMDRTQESLESALGMLVAIRQTTGVSPIAGTLEGGQLLRGESEILVWNSPDYDCTKIHQLLKRSALDHQCERELIVVGAGRAGHIDSGRIQPGRLEDISVVPRADDMTSSRARYIWWRPFPSIENILLNSQTTPAEKLSAITQELDAI